MRKYNVTNDYPIYEKHKDDIYSSTGKNINEFSLDAIL